MVTPGEPEERTSAVIGPPTLVVEQVQRVGATAFLRLAGELDAAMAPTVAAAVVAATSDGAREVVLDVGELTLVDAAGLDALVEIAEGLDGLVLRHPRPIVHRVLEVTGLDRRFLEPAGPGPIGWRSRRSRAPRQAAEPR